MSKNHKKFILLAILIILSMIGFFIGMQILKPRQQKVIGVSNSLIKINKNELVGITNVAVTGVVKNIKSFIRESKSLPGEKEVYSNITFEVASYLYNPKDLKSEEITIQIFGGEVDGLSMFVEGVSIPKIGHKYVFFLNKEDASNIFTGIGAQGTFEVNNDGSLGTEESQKFIIKNIFNQDLTVEQLKTELDSAKPEPLPGQKN